LRVLKDLALPQTLFFRNGCGNMMSIHAFRTAPVEQELVMRASTIGPRVGRVAVVVMLAVGAALIGASVAQATDMSGAAKVQADFGWGFTGGVSKNDFGWG